MASAHVMAMRPVASTRVTKSVGAIRPSPCGLSRSIFGPHLASSSRSSGVVSRAAKVDFDTVLSDFAEKFEALENKPVVIGYTVGAAAAILSAEYIMHLPLFNVLLGFPIQLLGLLSIPFLGIRYIVEEKDAAEDVVEALDKIKAQLPGLEK